ncbi:hypothetical protein QUA13_30925, partial [Microcoleus sp. S28C3]
SKLPKTPRIRLSQSLTLPKYVRTVAKATQIYELGFQVGWRYVRLKDYLLRIRKQRKLEESKQLQDYQQFLSFIRQKAESEDMDSFVSFGWRREKNSGQ